MPQALKPLMWPISDLDSDPRSSAPDPDTAPSESPAWPSPPAPEHSMPQAPLPFGVPPEQTADQEHQRQQAARPYQLPQVVPLGRRPSWPPSSSDHHAEYAQVSPLSPPQLAPLVSFPTHGENYGYVHSNQHQQHLHQSQHYPHGPYPNSNGAYRHPHPAPPPVPSQKRRLSADASPQPGYSAYFATSQAPPHAVETLHPYYPPSHGPLPSAYSPPPRRPSISHRGSHTFPPTSSGPGKRRRLESDNTEAPLATTSDLGCDCYSDPVVHQEQFQPPAPYSHVAYPSSRPSDHTSSPQLGKRRQLDSDGVEASVTATIDFESSHRSRVVRPQGFQPPAATYPHVAVPQPSSDDTVSLRPGERRRLDSGRVSSKL
jgi:hypothetical protein